jgi:hypothetical protein
LISRIFELSPSSLEFESPSSTAAKIAFDDFLGHGCPFFDFQCNRRKMALLRAASQPVLLERRGAFVSHRAGLYTVKVRPNRKPKDPPHLLGDIDGQGTALIDVLSGIAQGGLAVSTEDGLKAIACVSTTASGDQLRLVVQHGQTGVAADIVDANGAPRIHQRVDDQHRVKCAALFILPPAQGMGWLAVHVNNGRGITGLLVKGMVSEFRQGLPDLVMEITPLVLESALKEAVDEDRIDKVKLVRYETATDRAVQDTDKWIRTGADGKLELSITPRGPGRIIPEKVKRYLSDQDSATFRSIVEFQGITFDEAKVEVVLPGDMRRSFNIEKPDAGHAMTQDLENLPTDHDGEPTEDGLFAALVDALSGVVSSD